MYYLKQAADVVTLIFNLNLSTIVKYRKVLQSIIQCCFLLLNCIYILAPYLLLLKLPVKQNTLYYCMSVVLNSDADDVLSLCYTQKLIKYEMVLCYPVKHFFFPSYKSILKIQEIKSQ